MHRPVIYVSDILAWADAHKATYGSWPTAHFGRVWGQPNLTWCAIDMALRNGNRGLPGGSTLARLLAERRGARTRSCLPTLSVGQVLRWADAHKGRTGAWPQVRSGAIPGSGGETWLAVEKALERGSRGLPGPTSLAGLLAEHRGLRNSAGLPTLSMEQILAWADSHRRRTGRWPAPKSGPIPEAPLDTWSSVANALRLGGRGLRRTTLARLLAVHRGARNRKALPKLTAGKIVRWADAHQVRTGEWPTHSSGPVADAPGETWQGVEAALRNGARGLPGGSSLSQLLRARRGVDWRVRHACRKRVRAR
jgi:hypothetical protein